ncbi:MAG: peptidylprolyl isomerase [Deltaproteobacteria bacterium]|nr:peptidylprolyl isomerase [Deltaproteobacteria bacterium]
MLKMRIPAALAAATLLAALWAPAFAAESAPQGQPAPQAGTSNAEEPKAEQPKADAGPVATVNGTPIPRAELDRALRAYMQNFRQVPGSEMLEPNDSVKAEVVGQLVERELLYQESRKFAKADEKAAVDEEMKNLKGRFPSPEAFEEALKAQGLTEDELRALVGKQVSVRNYIETQVVPTATVSDEDVKKFYEENKDKLVVPEEVQASHILVRVAEDAKPEDKEKAKAKAEDLRKKAVEGADFAQLAKDNSEDPGSAPNGGDLGYFSKDRMVEPFANAAFALKPGEVSQVVETEFGFHVIKATGHKDATVRPLDEVKEDLTAYLKAKALNDAIQRKVADLKKTARIETSIGQK